MITVTRNPEAIFVTEWKEWTQFSVYLISGTLGLPFELDNILNKHWAMLDIELLVLLKFCCLIYMFNLPQAVRWI